MAAPIRQLLTICPGVRTMLETKEHSSPAVEFHVGELTVIASQGFEDDSVNLDRPADSWHVTGTNGLLPMGMALNSNWAALRRAYGAAVVNTTFEDQIHVIFCKFPRMYLALDPDFETIRPIDGKELTRIPPDAKIVAVLITLWPFGDSQCAGVQH